MTTPRIPPLRLEDADFYQAEILSVFPPDQLLNLFTTLAHHSKLLKSWLPLGGRLLYGGTLDARDRELAILRTSARCDASYEWGQHVAIARSAGLSDEEIMACAGEGSDRTLGEFDRTLRDATDQLVDHHRIDDETWEALSERYDNRQLIELTMLVGHYAMLAGTLNSICVEVDGPLPPIGSVS